ncbi:Transposase [Popillia japonica]|uniref:Transposase n=1 Tax=Popillia japonica TaxID=7064 RepID=A0AAW1J0Z5_POPJA
MGKGRDVSEEKKKIICALIQTGNYSVRKIARMQGVSHPVVVRLAQQLKNNQEVGSSNKRRSGRKRITSARDDRKITAIVRDNRRKSVRELRKDIQTAGIRISQRTLERRLAESGFKSVRPTKKPLLTKKMKVARLEFAREYSNFTLEDWKRVYFSDEATFHCLTGTGKNVRRRKTEKLHSSCIEKRAQTKNRKASFVVHRKHR